MNHFALVMLTANGQSTIVRVWSEAVLHHADMLYRITGGGEITILSNGVDGDRSQEWRNY